MGGSVAFVGGRVFTGARYVEALLVEDGRVLAAGSRREVLHQRPTGVRTVDLAGRLAVPGLIDAHYHLTDSALKDRSVDLRGTRDLADLLGRVEGAARGGRGTLFGFGWDVARWPTPVYPTRRDLDRVLADRPAVLYRVCGHVAVVNSAALEHLDPGRPDGRADERWGRDANGDLNGILEENALRELRPLHTAAVRERPESLREDLARMARFGVTTVGAVSASPAEVEAVAELESTHPIASRLRFYVTPAALGRVAALRSALSATPHEVIGLKLVTDGSLGARTAWLSEPYADAPEGSGVPLGRAEEIAEALVEAGRLGLQPALHAIGDRAVHRVLRLLLAHAALARAPRVEHASVLPPTLFPLLDRVRPVLVVQPAFIRSDSWLNERLGPSRARWTYPWRTVLERGHALAGSSDSPYDSPDPWYGMAAAAAPRDATAPSPGGDVETIDLAQAFALYTSGGALALDERSLGSLEPGAHADLAVLDSPDLEGAVRSVGSPVRSTWLGGEVVHETMAPPASPSG